MFLRAGRFFGAGVTLSLVFWGTVFTCGPEFEKHEKSWHIQLTTNLDPKRNHDNSQQETYAPAFLRSFGDEYSEFEDPKTASSPVYRLILRAFRNPAPKIIINGLILLVMMILDRIIGKADNASGCGWFVVFVAVVLFFWGLSVYGLLQSGIETGYHNVHTIPDEVLNP